MKQCENCKTEMEILNPIEVIRFNPPKRITEKFNDFEKDMKNPKMSDVEIHNKWDLSPKELRALSQYYGLCIPDNVEIKGEKETGIPAKDREIFIFV